ncbi:MAG: division/cell wall cluster transcriptional repressor MraZ [Oscillospiraceae bacterium]|nr:division/cell wall cluster transcriptional repressor MraZ [Oscillospiraceae bacterium]
MRGEYAHIIDEKGRLFIPSKFRSELGCSFVLTKGLGKCLSAYPLTAWASLEEKIKALPTRKSRELQLFFVASSHDMELDGQGRILVPQKLREYANLSKNLVTVGMIDHLEIWSEEEWEAQNLTPDYIADVMDEAGI